VLPKNVNVMVDEPGDKSAKEKKPVTPCPEPHATGGPTQKPGLAGSVKVPEGAPIAVLPVVEVLKS
jgi:hypothetical protein